MFITVLVCSIFVNHSDLLRKVVFIETTVFLLIKEARHRKLKTLATETATKNKTKTAETASMPQKKIKTKTPATVKNLF